MKYCRYCGKALISEAATRYGYCSEVCRDKKMSTVRGNKVLAEVQELMRQYEEQKQGKIVEY